MSYSISNIILWMKISQPLAAYGEKRKRAVYGKSPELDLDVQLYDCRKDIEYEYDQDADSENLFQMANYGLALCGTYLFQAQQASTGGGSISPVGPEEPPSSIQFNVSASTTVTTGSTTATISSFIGYELMFARGGILQTTVDEGGGATYYSWDRDSGLLTISPAAISGELFQLYPV